MTPLQAIIQAIAVLVGVAAFVVLIATNKVTSDVGIPIITGLLGTLTAPVVTQSGKLGSSSPNAK
jgi:hypothetical protein